MGVSATILTFCAYLLISCSILFGYVCYKFNQYQTKLYFQKRSVPFIKTFLALSGVDVCVMIPGSLLLRFADPSVPGIVLAQIIFRLAGSTLINGAAIIIISRYFLRFVNIRRCQDMENIMWKQKINKNYKANKDSWILKYYYIFGNPNKLFNVTLIIWIIETIVSIIMVFVIGSIFDDLTTNEGVDTAFSRWYMTLTSAWIFKVILLGYCIYHTKGFIDHWHLGREFKYLFASFLIDVMFLTLTTNTIARILGDVGHANQIGGVCIGIWLVSCWFINILWVIYVNEKSTLLIHMNSNQENRSSLPSLHSILESQEGYTILMQHMMKEFSSENLLFLTLMIQWENILIKNKILDFNLDLDGTGLGDSDGSPAMTSKTVSQDISQKREEESKSDHEPSVGSDSSQANVNVQVGHAVAISQATLLFSPKRTFLHKTVPPSSILSDAINNNTNNSKNNNNKNDNNKKRKDKLDNQIATKSGSNDTQNMGSDLKRKLSQPIVLNMDVDHDEGDTKTKKLQKNEEKNSNEKNNSKKSDINDSSKMGELEEQHRAKSVSVTSSYTDADIMSSDHETYTSDIFQIRNASRTAASSAAASSDEEEIHTNTKKYIMKQILFVNVFQEIFYQFIQRDRAPLQLNISHALRETFHNHIENIDDTFNVTDIKMLQIWRDLHRLTKTVTVLIHGSYRRINRKQVSQIQLT